MYNLITKISHQLDRKKVAFLLLIYTAITRLAIISTGVIPFTFDHGKDSIAILHMIKTLSPKFVGPWTSIPGLFFGPGWYYLLAPAYLLTNGHPLSPVLIMLLLLLLQVYLAYKYFGFIPALIMATAPTWITISTSTWNPFPITLVMLLLLILLKKLSSSNKPKPKLFFSIGLISALGFHFSSAFSVSLLISVPIIMIMKHKLHLSRKNIGSTLAGFLIPWTPQLLFEVKNGFIQTKGIITYFTESQPTIIQPSQFDIIRSVISELMLGISPELRLLPQLFPALKTLMLFVVLLGFLKLWQSKAKLELAFEIVVISACAIMVVSVTHYNYWYIYGLLPGFVIITSQLISRINKKLRNLILILLLLTPISTVTHFLSVDQHNLSQRADFLPLKLKALSLIRETAGSEPFASYHYAPHIYDFSYQYLYLWQAFNAKSLPTEFSYDSTSPTYIPEKTALLEQLNIPTQNPSHIFFIIEGSQDSKLFKEWWNRQNYSQIHKTTQLSPTMTIIHATP